MFVVYFLHVPNTIILYLVFKAYLLTSKSCRLFLIAPLTPAFLPVPFLSDRFSTENMHETTTSITSMGSSHHPYTCPQQLVDQLLLLEEKLELQVEALHSLHCTSASPGRIIKRASPESETASPMRFRLSLLF